MDYCTHFPEGWWAACCQAHDVAYAEQIGRLAADAGLFSCVAHSAGNGATSLIAGVIGLTMFLGVRLFFNRGAVIKIDGVPLELEHDITVLVHAANVPLLSSGAVAACKSERGD